MSNTQNNELKNTKTEQFKLLDVLNKELEVKRNELELRKKESDNYKEVAMSSLEKEADRDKLAIEAEKGHRKDKKNLGICHISNNIAIYSVSCLQK